jgi:hypothetical protein
MKSLDNCHELKALKIPGNKEILIQSEGAVMGNDIGVKVSTSIYN